ncbi:BID domain-containing T4SS effector [Bartonella taylorii]|uniref:BID domain-containing T4SS effector n=1 Tax=Bartonella taylorii TaxID=33046 RepID=UPI001ABA2E80|nr:BID domain-containing T4SS effector [Bartonella taylorii]
MKKKQIVDVKKQETQDSASQSFFYDNDTVLKNKYNIRDNHALQQKCSEDVKQAMAKLRAEPLPKKIDSSYLKKIHKTLFSETFEWAGKTRGQPFQFADGSIAFTPLIKRKEFQSPFASSDQVEKRLRSLDQTLADSNYLKNLSREEFVQHAAGLMINLLRTHPFREGNKRTIQVFFEKLGEAAGHPLDFSLVSNKRKIFASVEAIDNSNPEPIKNLLEDISNHKKMLLLKEFNQEMRRLGLNEDNYRPAVVAHEGLTYHGTYRGSGPRGFMMDVCGTFILGDKKDLSPEQMQTLKIGDSFSFTAPVSEKLQQILIPEKVLTSLSKEELVKRIQENRWVQEHKKHIEALCKTVYGRSRILQEKINEINKNFARGYQVALQISNNPTSFSKLAGFKICGIKNNARICAEDTILTLGHAILEYIKVLEHAKEHALQSYSIENKCYEKSVKMPSPQIKKLFSLPKEQQQAALSTSPRLGLEVQAYFQKLNERLSPIEHEAIKERDYTKLAKNLGTSVNQAEKIAEIFRKTKEICAATRQQNFEMRQHMERGLRQPITQSNKEKLDQIGATPTQEKKVLEFIRHKKVPEEQGQRHHAKSMKL